MKVEIKEIEHHDYEKVTIECVEVTPDIESIRSYVSTKGTTLHGVVGERTYPFNLHDVIYFEAVDERVYAKTVKQSYELKIRLYELENAHHDKHFLRCSKSFMINLLKLESVSPALNGRFIAHMSNKEKIIISRQYVPELKRIILGGK